MWELEEFLGWTEDGNIISGFSNWVSFQKEESEGDLNYLSYMDMLKLGDKVSTDLMKGVE